MPSSSTGGQFGGATVRLHIDEGGHDLCIDGPECGAMAWSRRELLAATAVSTGVLSGCSRGSPPYSSGDRPPESIQRPAVSPEGADHLYTHLRAGGNRIVDGSGGVDTADPVDIPVPETPTWVLASDAGPASLWTVVTDDDRARVYRVADGDSEVVADHGTVATPPLGSVRDGNVGLVGAHDDGAAHTHPVPLEDGWLYVAADGDAVIRRDGGSTRLDVDAPPDARIVALGGGRYALYGGRTDRYRHGALGDTTEGSRLVVVDAERDRPAVDVVLDRPTVFEGLSPLVADVDGDGADEIVTTVADSVDGARLRLYGTDGSELATGPVYGPGWRHQLCVAPFGPDGGPELAVVRKPHVDRTLEFYRFDADLRVVATQGGFATHTYGSRNLDGALAADLDGDGRTELLAPTSDRSTLGAVRRTHGGAETVWSLSLPGPLVTNVAGVALDDGRAVVGAGTAGGVRVWPG